MHLSLIKINNLVEKWIINKKILNLKKKISENLFQVDCLSIKYVIIV